MDKLNENINRIKQLMSLVENEQLSFDFDEEPIDNKEEPSKPKKNTSSQISTNSDEFTKKYKEKVYYILKDLYKSNWDSDSSRGPRGGGGVVDIFTVYDLLKEKGLDDYDPEGGNWSILNYFDTNPQVRKRIINLYKTETKNDINSEETMDDFIKWMSRNRNKIFEEGPILKELVQLNAESLYQGELNERKAYQYLTKILENLPGWKLKGRSVPGSKSDRDGIDFVMEKENSDKTAKFQAKPLNQIERVGKFYKVKSYNIKNIDKKPVDYFVFASSENDNIYIFRNNIDKYVILDNDTIQFEEAPIKF
jgi:hypothetical protein